MLLSLKSNFVLKKLFDLLENTLCLKIISYNKLFQSKLSKNIEDFKKAAKIYIIFEDKGTAKEYDKESNDLIFEGEYKNKKRNGLGKEYSQGKLLFEGQYKDGLKNGQGKKYDEEGKLLFEGIYLNGEEWEGEGQIIEKEKIDLTDLIDLLDLTESYDKTNVIYYGKITEGKIKDMEEKLILILI